MNKIILSLVLVLGALLALSHAAPQFDFSDFSPEKINEKFKETFNMDGFKACIDQLKVPNVKECFEKFDKSDITKIFSCTQEKFASVSDKTTMNKCVPDAVRNLFPKSS